MLFSWERAIASFPSASDHANPEWYKILLSKNYFDSPYAYEFYPNAVAFLFTVLYTLLFWEELLLDIVVQPSYA